MVPAQVERLVDINLLPDRYRRRWPSPTTVLAWLLLSVLLGSLFLSYRFLQSATARQSAQRAALEAAQGQLTVEDTFAENLEALRTDLQASQETAADLRQTAEDLTVQEIRWGATLTSVLDRTPAGLEIASIHQAENTVELRGTADHYYLPLAYAAELENANPESEVTVQEIHLLDGDAEQDVTPTPPAAEAAEPEGQPIEDVIYEYMIRMEYPQLDGRLGSDESGGTQ